MRIDFSWGSDRARVEHPVARVAEIVLGRCVDDRTFGPALPWLDVLFVVPGKGKPRPPKAMWRWRGSFAGHLIVEMPAPADASIASLAGGVRALIEAVPAAIVRARPELDSALAFDAAALLRQVAACLATLPNEKALRAIQADIEPHHRARFAAIERGREAMHRSWRRPLVRPLSFVRVHAVGRIDGRRGPLADACRMVGALLGSALSDAILTPGYSEIYVNVGTDEETVRFHRTALEDWSRNAYAVLGAKPLADTDPRRLRRLLFDAACDAVLELANVDHLDADAIRRRLAQVDVDGLTTEFVYRRVHKAPYDVELTYSLDERKDSGAIIQPIFYLRATDTATGASASWPLGPADLQETGRALTKLTIGARDVRIAVRRGSTVETLRFPLP